MNDFNIQAASLISGVSQHQIRAWEKRYDAVTPRRLGNNFRSYSQENITRLKLLGYLTRCGIAISKIAKLSTSELQTQSEKLRFEEKSQVGVEVINDGKEKLEFLLVFLSSKKIDIIKHEISKFQTLSTVTQVLIPLMKKIMHSSDFKDVEEQELLINIIENVKRISVQVATNPNLYL
jgi:DNA-binding transcriptional MerR regulator